jgi:hypothetical protein
MGEKVGNAAIPSPAARPASNPSGGFFRQIYPMWERHFVGNTREWQPPGELRFFLRVAKMRRCDATPNWPQ